MLRRVALLVSLALLSACASLTTVLDPPNVSLAGIELKELGLFEQQFLLKLRLQNPNGVTLPIAGMDYELTLNDQKFARGVSNQAVDVPAHGEALTDVTVTSNLQSLLNQLGPIASSGGTVDYRVTGNVSIVNRSLKLPFDYSGSIGFPELASGNRN